MLLPSHNLHNAHTLTKYKWISIRLCTKLSRVKGLYIIPTPLIMIWAQKDKTYRVKSSIHSTSNQNHHHIYYIFDGPIYASLHDDYNTNPIEHI